MKELIRRLFLNPICAIEILAASFFIAVLTLALPLYVIQILGRYINYGFHGTLVTLTSGMVIAIFILFGFKIIRTKIAGRVNRGPNEILAGELFDIVCRSKAAYVKSLSKGRMEDTIQNVQILQNAYSAFSLITLLDAPFSLVLIGAAFLLSPVLAGMGLICIFCALCIGFVTTKHSQKGGDALVKELSGYRNLNMSALNALESVRAFSCPSFLEKKWAAQAKTVSVLRSKLSDNNEFSQALTQSLGMFLSVLIYALGATLVVKRQLSVGALIGTNILVSRAFQNTTNFVRVWAVLARAKQASKELELIKRLPSEPLEGSALKSFSGTIEFVDSAFSYPLTTTPVFESLNLKLDAGSILAVTGRTGTGKSTILKLTACLYDPSRGKILADGFNLAQAARSWWRRQIIYMPQYPEFFNGSIRENILVNADIKDHELNHILRITGLKQFLDQTPEGLDYVLLDNGINLPLGIRRLITLARAMTTDGQLVIFDEPTDGLDPVHAAVIYKILNDYAKRNKTILVSSKDHKILKGVSFTLDMNPKPCPEFSSCQST